MLHSIENCYSPKSKILTLIILLISVGNLREVGLRLGVRRQGRELNLTVRLERILSDNDRMS